ncbi:MAG: hypothetical protein HC899_08860 [Leptolyngbyaceae cyanobacterium SM1_4_3]|nr:hypothetical protein [Leptolyngbyaceae cyanobacterium SM1_4_3]NJN89573.1 hypothetical protein [Leptolyngbyaceae cyanobacterium SL_5_14]
MVPPSSLNEVIQELAQEQNLTRIKKLLVYACTDIWESNQARLDEFDLRNLVQDLLETAPTLEELKLYLNGVVKTLNKQAEYALVANAITNVLKKTYPGYESLPQEVSLQSHYRKIARELARDREQLGIKKLLFCASGNHWENNPAILDNIDFLNLVQHIHELAPTLEELKNVLYSIVKTLNHKSKYTPIANRIVTTFGSVYNEFLPDEMNEPEPIQVTDLPQLPTFPSKLTTAPKFNSADPQVLEQLRRSFNWFDLRLELMKHANPLRAKILIFSSLYDQFDQDDGSWTAFKLQTLDDLLRDLCFNHRSLEDLQFKLENTVKGLAESEQYSQTASAILRAAKPFYAAGIQQNTPVMTQVVERSPHTSSVATGISSPANLPQPEPPSPANSSTPDDGDRQRRHQQAYEAFLTAVEDLFTD